MRIAGNEVHLSGDEVATAIAAYLAAHNVNTFGPRTITVDVADSGRILGARASTSTRLAASGTTARPASRREAGSMTHTDPTDGPPPGRHWPFPLGYVPMSADPPQPQFRLTFGWATPAVLHPKHAIKPDWLCVFCGIKIEGPDLSCEKPECVAQVPNDENGTP